MAKTEKNDRPPLLIHTQFEEVLNRQSDVDRGKLLSALMAYQWHQKDPVNLNDRLAGIFETLRSFADADYQKWLQKKQDNKEKIKNYWDSIRAKEANKPQNTDEY